MADIFICEKIEHNLLEIHSSNIYTNIYSSIYTNTNIYKNINTYTIDNVNVEECESIDFLKGSCSVNSDNVSFISKDKLIEKIKIDIQNGTLNELISNVLGGDKKDYLYKDDNIIYQITSTYNQNNNQNNNISTIILGECEKIVKKKYNLSEDLALLIFKIDYYKKGSSIPIIGYEIYHPITKTKLDLKYCNNANISINIPVSINEDNLLKYDPNNEYYTNECTPSTTENGTDILLNDRQDEFNNNNMFLCEQNCTYNGYNNKTASCECRVKLQQIVISEIVDENNVATYNFTNKNDMTTMKCYQTLFSKNGLIKNIGNYIMLFIVLLIMTSSILFYKCGYYLLEEKINEIINRKEKVNNKISKCETIDMQQNQIKQKDKKYKKDKKNSSKNLRIKQTKSLKKMKSKNKVD